MKSDKLTRADIAQWIDNDEGLYNWCRRWCRENRKPRSKFITENREELERCIRRVLDGTKPPHYLAYGG